MCTFAALADKPSPPHHHNMKADSYLIKLARFQQGYTQAELAKLAKISLSVVIKAEHGKSISARSHRAILDALGLK